MPITPADLTCVSQKVFSDEKAKAVIATVVSGLTLKNICNDVFLSSNKEEPTQSIYDFGGKIKNSAFGIFVCEKLNSMLKKRNAPNIQFSAFYDKCNTYRG